MRKERNSDNTEVPACAADGGGPFMELGQKEIPGEGLG